MLSKANPSITELSITYEPDSVASFITELDSSEKSLDILKTRSTGPAWRIVPESLNYYANISFASAMGSARFMD